MPNNSDPGILHSLPDNSINRENKLGQTGVYLIWWFIGFMFFVFLILLVIALRQQPQTRTVAFDPQSASILSALSPEVSVKEPTAQNFQAINADKPITAGTEIKTGPGAQAVIFSGDGIITTLKERSRVVVQKNNNEKNQSRFELLSGGLWARVDSALTKNESYEVKAGDTITSVRGTEFAVNKKDKSITVSGIRDEVAMETKSVSTSSQSLAAVTALSGQQITAPTSSTRSLAKQRITEQNLRQLIQSHTEVSNAAGSLQLSDNLAVMEGIPVLSSDKSRRADSWIDSRFNGFEHLGEFLYESLFVSGKEEQLRFSLLQAQERLQELTATEINKQDTETLLQELQSALVKVSQTAENSTNSELQRTAVKATRLYTRNIGAIIPDTVKSQQILFRQAKNIAAASHRSTVNALASTSPRQASKEISRSMNNQLASAQSATVNADGQSVRDSLQEYNRFLQENEKVSRKNTDTAVSFADQLRKNLSVFITLDRINTSTSSGLDRRISEAKTNVIDSQTSILKDVATSSPNEVADIYKETVDFYIDRISHSQKQEDIRDHLSTLETYTSFGEELTSGSDTAGSTSTLQTKMKDIAANHQNQLTEARKNVPQSAETTFEQIIRNQQRIQQEDPIYETGEDTRSPATTTPNQNARESTENADNQPNQSNPRDADARDATSISSASNGNDGSRFISAKRYAPTGPFDLFAFNIKAEDMPVTIEQISVRFVVDTEDGRLQTYQDIVNEAVLLINGNRYTPDSIDSRASANRSLSYDLIFNFENGVTYDDRQNDTVRFAMQFNQASGSYDEGTRIRTTINPGGVKTAAGVQNQTDVPWVEYILRIQE